MRPNRDRTAVRALTVTAVTGLLVGVLLLTRSPESDAPDQARSAEQNGPAQCVSDMISLQKAGNVPSYLDQFAGPLRGTLERRLTETDGVDPSVELQATASGLTGYVTSRLEIDGDSATLDLERIYRDYNERHAVRLRRVAGSWKIVELKSKDRFAPQIPYGTPVFVPPQEDEQNDAVEPKN